jgi:amino acid permease
MSRLSLARTIQLLFIFVCACALLLPSTRNAAFDAKNLLLALGSLLLAMILVALKCPRCGYSLYRTKNYRINLLVPASRVFSYRQTRRD